MAAVGGSSLANAAVIGAVGAFSKIWLSWLNRLVVHRLDVLQRCMGAGQPLITVANHHSCIDEPIIWGILPWSVLLGNPLLMRWVLAAREIVFTNPVYSVFFSLGRCVPIIRGHGVYQPGVDHCLEVLNNNGWVHVFPEGMEKVLPQTALVPRILKKVLVYVGQPMAVAPFEEIRRSPDGQDAKRIRTTDLIHRELYRLQSVAESLYGQWERP